MSNSRVLHFSVWIAFIPVVVLASSRVYEYAVVCPPILFRQYPSVVGCNITIASINNNTNVNITSISDHTVLILDQRAPVTITTDVEMLTKEGIEDKGFYITSSHPLSVVVMHLDQFDWNKHIETYVAIEKQDLNPDFWIDNDLDKGVNDDPDFDIDNDLNKEMNDVPNISINDTSTNRTDPDFIAVSYFNYGPQCNGIIDTTHFINIIPFYDDTQIRLGESTDDLTLMRFQTLTITNTDPYDDFVSGLQVRSTRPVFVISGCLCVVNMIATSDSSSGFVSVLPVNKMGSVFPIPPIYGKIQAGYSVRIIPKHNDTKIKYDRTLTITNSPITLDFNLKETMNKVTCIPNCNIVLISKSISHTTGTFMLNLLPTERFYSNVFFAPPMFLEQAVFMTIVALGTPPINGISLNDVSLADQAWISFEQFSYITVTAERKVYEITSTNELFVVYFYSHSENFAGGYGFTPLSQS